MTSRSHSTHPRTSDRGAALPFVAGVLAALLGLAALAVDLGWIYLNAHRLQRAADAAALAGVVHLPAFPNRVEADAIAGATANGFEPGEGANTLSWRAVSDNKLEVTLTSEAPSFFTNVLGFSSFPISRTATAEYIKPVPMGSPTACFGVGDKDILPSSLSHCSSAEQNFWAAINGDFTAKEHGDPFAVRCIRAGASSGTCNGPNSDYRAPDGAYYYGIEIPAGKSSFTVRIYDAGFYDRATPQTETGDYDGLAYSASGGPTTQFRLYNVDSTPLDPTDNPIISSCSRSIGPGQDPGTYKNKWFSLCTINNPAPGIYVLRVDTSGNGGGNNSYAIGVSTVPNSVPHARVYGINDMSIFTNATSGTAYVYLAEIDPIHRGKRLELNFYDPGENCGGVTGCTGKPGLDAFVEVIMPNGDTPTCTWQSRNDAGTVTNSGSGKCRIQSTDEGIPQFNGEWLTAWIDIPSDYDCDSDCFWRMALDMKNAQDRTTWAARVIGNPIRLAPNE